MNSSIPEAVTWQELLEETLVDMELSSLKEAIARGYFTVREKGALGPQYDSIFTELAVVGRLVVRGARIVVPKSLRDKVVKLAHEGHQTSPKPRSIYVPECGSQGWTGWWKRTSRTATLAK